MITQFNCPCGNNNPLKAKEYHGCMGYEAIICTCCGRYFDENNGENAPDEFSKEFIIELDRHHFARLIMMKAEERGEDISYEEAINSIS